MPTLLISLGTIAVTLVSLLVWYLLIDPHPDHVDEALAHPKAPNAKQTAAADALEDALPGRVLRRQDGASKICMKSYWSAQKQEVVPECFVRPNNAEDVATAVLILSRHFLNQSDGDLHFAVRSGGHAPDAGGANVHNGITIDLSALNRVTLSEDQQLATVGPAATWAQVYEKLERMELMVCGGRSADVGVGGLCLGGGLSFFSPCKGFVCDSIAEYELVLADGSIATVNSTTHADLFLALKGGSNNFGIVTKLVLRVFPFPQGKLFFGSTIHWISTLPQHVDAFLRFSNPETYDEYSGVILALLYKSSIGVPLVAPGLSYTKPVENPPALQPFLSIPRLWSWAKTKRISDAVREIGSGSPRGLRNVFQTTTFELNLEMLHFVGTMFNASYPKVKARKGISWAVILQPLPPSTTAHSHSNNALGISTKKTLVNVLLNATWSRASDDEIISRVAAEMFTAIEDKAHELGVYHRYKYLNYAASSQDPIAGYGEKNREILKGVSRKYDKHGLFQKGCVGGFKVFP